MSVTAQSVFIPNEMMSESAQMLRFLRALGTEDQRIAYAVLEGMQLQRKLDTQNIVDAHPKPALRVTHEGR